MMITNSDYTDYPYALLEKLHRQAPTGAMHRDNEDCTRFFFLISEGWTTNRSLSFAASDLLKIKSTDCRKFLKLFSRTLTRPRLHHSCRVNSTSCVLYTIYTFPRGRRSWTPAVGAAAAAAARDDYDSPPLLACSRAGRLFLFSRIGCT